MSCLDYETYLAFLGCVASKHRTDIFKQIKPLLSKAADHFWSDHSKIIERGVIYQGRIERITHYTGKFFNLFGHKKIKALFSFDNIDEQRAYVKRHWNTFFLRKFLETMINPRFLKYIINDPGLNSFVDVKHPGAYLYNRMMDCLHHHLAKKSPLLQLVFCGSLLPDAYFSYLTYEGYEKIRHDTTRLHYQTGNIIEYLAQEKNAGIDCFSLSDIASYMPQNVFEELLQSMYGAANPNARFCLREFMSHRYIPETLQANFIRDNELEKKLEKEETNFVYRFMVGEIIK